MTASMVEYVLSVLLDESESARDSNALHKYCYSTEATSEDVRVIIIPSGFFDENTYGTAASLPEAPLQEIEGVPLLFGKPLAQWEEYPDGKRRFVVYADLIASAYFLLTRYEEIVRRDVRDEHGRFPGFESLPYRAGFLERPIVEEYGALLRKWLREAGVDVAEPEREFRVVLTHDVDFPFRYNTLINSIISAGSNLRRQPLKVFTPLAAWAGLCRDPFDTFDWIIHNDNALRDQLGEDRVDIIYFFKALRHGIYGDSYQIAEWRLQKLRIRLVRSGAKLGLHPSYAAGGTPELIADEKEALETMCQTPIFLSRHHYLRWREPEHVQYLEESGLTEDYTLGYADHIGYRLGVSRPVRFFDPVARRLTNVTVHPLVVMDVTLGASVYMNLPREEAERTIEKILAQTHKWKGELVLLWHNNEFVKEYYQKLYQKTQDNILLIEK